jgi:hypothetical protein
MLMTRSLSGCIRLKIKKPFYPNFFLSVTLIMDVCRILDLAICQDFGGLLRFSTPKATHCEFLRTSILVQLKRVPKERTV